MVYKYVENPAAQIDYERELIFCLDVCVAYLKRPAAFSRHGGQNISAVSRQNFISGCPQERYILNGEACTSVREIDHLYQKAVREFTCAVAKKGKKHYSTVTENVIHFIHIHLHEKITLESAAQKAGISPCHLSRTFKKETGMSFVDYIQKERVEAARHMLIYSEYTISEISEYLHFSTESYFIRIFRKYMETTPARYRKYYREQERW